MGTSGGKDLKLLASADPCRKAGRTLKQIRERLGLTTREVEEASQNILVAEKNGDFLISNARLTQIENDGSMPSIYKIYSLAAIYRLKLEEILQLYGVEVKNIEQHGKFTPASKTRLIPNQIADRERRISFPIRFDPGFRPEKTTFISRLIQAWEEIPIGLLQGLDLKRHTYGYIGLEDCTMYPLIRPGSIVQIDTSRKKPQITGWRNEFERPIYFIELRYSYECCWCHRDGKQLTLIPYPLSGLGPKTVMTPDEGEILGQVVGVVMRVAE